MVESVEKRYWFGRIVFFFKIKGRTVDPDGVKNHIVSSYYAIF